PQKPDVLGEFRSANMRFELAAYPVITADTKQGPPCRHSSASGGESIDQISVPFVRDKISHDDENKGGLVADDVVGPARLVDPGDVDPVIDDANSARIAAFQFHKLVQHGARIAQYPIHSPVKGPFQTLQQT